MSEWEGFIRFMDQELRDHTEPEDLWGEVYGGDLFLPGMPGWWFAKYPPRGFANKLLETMRGDMLPDGWGNLPDRSAEALYTHALSDMIVDAILALRNEAKTPAMRRGEIYVVDYGLKNRRGRIIHACDTIEQASQWIYDNVRAKQEASGGDRYVIDGTPEAWHEQTGECGGSSICDC